MQLSKRETQLIELFIKHGMTLTAQELAEFANVSTKTIYRTIKKINEASVHQKEGIQFCWLCYSNPPKKC